MPRSNRRSPSPHERGERAGVRGAFYLNLLRTPFAPSARAAGVLFRMSRVALRSNAYRGRCYALTRSHRHSRAGENPVLASYVFGHGSAVALKLPRTRLRAGRILLTTERSFSPPASYFSWRKKSNQKNIPRCLRRAIANAIARSPALLGRGGVHRQAIPGLTMDASASCLARVCARLIHLVLRCSAQPDGEERQRQHQKQGTALPPSSFPRKRESRGPSAALRYLLLRPRIH